MPLAHRWTHRRDSLLLDRSASCEQRGQAETYEGEHSYSQSGQRRDGREGLGKIGGGNVLHTLSRVARPGRPAPRVVHDHQPAATVVVTVKAEHCDPPRPQKGETPDLDHHLGTRTG